MSFIISPILPFPNISWWSSLIAESSDTNAVLFDSYEHFEKMTFRNRYIIATANGETTLSIPLLQGRDQRTPMKDVLISNRDRWQMQHWRTLVSAYRRSPFFEYYEHQLKDLFTQPFEKLVDFNMASIKMLQGMTGMIHDYSFSEAYHKEYNNAVADLRKSFRSKERNTDKVPFPKYYQVFENRNGFLPNLSILDLLFSEGPHTRQWLKECN